MLGNSQSEQAGGSRRESRKRRRLSERRRVFGLLGLSGGEAASMAKEVSRGSRSGSALLDDMDLSHLTNRSDSPLFLGLGEQEKISMKIQFHITVAPETEPLILDTNHIISQVQETTPTTSAVGARNKSIDLNSATTSIGEHIHERLTRQNTLSTRRRQQLLAMHQQPALNSNGSPPINGTTNDNEQLIGIRSEENLAKRNNEFECYEDEGGRTAAACGRDVGVRSSTISGTIQDEATSRFLARQQMRPGYSSPSSIGGSLGVGSPSLPVSSVGGDKEREHIYFKRDGQRFGHEFTLKLSVDKTYRCLLKVRPLIPLQGISIQGHHVSFVNCGPPSQHYFGSGSSAALNNSRQSLISQQSMSSAPNGIGYVQNLKSQNYYSARTATTNTTKPVHPQQNPHHYHRLNHAQTMADPYEANQRRMSNLAARQSQQTSGVGQQETYGGGSLSLSSTMSKQLQQQLLRQQQQSQMMRHFASSHCSASNSHLGGQLIYMFDWSASRFEVNKNKDRTQINTVLKFKNGQILSLPLQVKFYQPERKQHLNWGSQLHFIDYDCNINSMGQINVDRVQYY